jgi:hypothetical protein
VADAIHDPQSTPGGEDGGWETAVERLFDELQVRFQHEAANAAWSEMLLPQPAHTLLVGLLAVRAVLRELLRAVGTLRAGDRGGARQAEGAAPRGDCTARAHCRWAAGRTAWRAAVSPPGRR